MMVGRRARNCGTLWLAAAALTLAGCNRQDADCLARIGNLLTQKAQSLRQKSATNNRLSRTLPELGIGEPVGPASVIGDPDSTK
jgi:hypothetical protein